MTGAASANFPFRPRGWSVCSCWPWAGARHLIEQPWLYDLSQLAIAAVAVASVAILFAAIEHGLASPPDMRVVGNGSTSAMLRWCQDRAAPRLPAPCVISTPLLVHRAATLL